MAKSAAQKYLEAVKAELLSRRAIECADNFLEFVKEFWDIVEPGREFKLNWHHVVLAEHLQAVSNGEIRNLLVNIPPGTSKSTFASVLWPAWEWATRPHLRYFGASYSEPLAIRDAMLCRKIIQSDKFQRMFPEGARVAKGEDNQRRYATQQSGWRLATSVGGRGTGEHPDRKLVDDPHNVKQSESAVERQAALDWYDGTLSSRGVIHGAATVVIMQRLHQLDLSGHIERLASYKTDWVHLVIPMEYEVNRIYPVTPLGFKDPRKKDGDLLWPEMFTPAQVDVLKSTLGSYKTAGQLQQRPAPEGGGIFKSEHFQIWPRHREIPDFEFIIQSYDTAYTENTANDPSACSVWGVFQYKNRRHVMLLDAWREWLEYSKLRHKMMELWTDAKYGGRKDPVTGQDDLLHPPRRADMLVLEKRGSGLSLVQDLRRASLPLHDYDPGGRSKVARAHQTESVMATKCVWVPESHKEAGKPVSWARDLIEECLLFPNAEHDDFVDTTTQSLIWLSATGHLEMPAVKEEDVVQEVDYSMYSAKGAGANPYGV